MNFHELKPYFIFSKSQRNGIFVLVAAIIIFQTIYYFSGSIASENVQPRKQQWMKMQTKVDSIKQTSKPEVPKIYPFNPNFITDFKGYKLGMSVAEIDRLLNFRKTNRYVNSAKEFQQVTEVSDSLLKAIAPYFKFPDWVTNKQSKYPQQAFGKFASRAKAKIVVGDINTATQVDLKKIYGIGDGLSDRILKEKEKFGGFVSMDQMSDIWGLSPEVIEKLNQSYKVGIIPSVKKININNASVKELAQFPYFRYRLAKAIVTFRSMNGDIKSAEDLAKISEFPADKIQIIALYLEF